MLEPFVVAVLALSVGAGAGALAAIRGYIAGLEPFDGKKFATGVITGIIAGVTLVLANIAVIQEAVDETALLIQLVTIVLAIVGVDAFRSTASKAVALRANKEKAKGK